MAIKGSLKEASLPDVLQLLALGQKTGCLSIADRSNFGYIYFDKGRICYASIVNRRDRLGDILVKHQKIRSDQLDAAIHRQSKERDKKLGEILVGMGVISQEDLERYMRVQIEESVYYLFTWTQGTFNFESEVRPERQDFLVNINPESLLLEGARRVDEWSLIEKKIPSFDLIFTVDKDRLAISEAALTETQQRVLPLLDGARDMNQVIEDSELHRAAVGVPRLVVARPAVGEVGQVLGQLRQRRLVLAGGAHQLLRGLEVAGQLLQHGQVVEQHGVRRVGGGCLPGQLLGELEVPRPRGRQGARPVPRGGRRLARELLRAVEPAGGARVVALLQGDDAPPQVHADVRAGTRRRLRVGSLRLLQPAELLVGVGEVVEHRGPTTPLLGREPQGLHRFTPARLLQGDEPDEEVGVRLAGP